MDKIERVNHPSREDAFHDKDNKITLPLAESLDANIKNINYLFKNCMDVVKREVDIGTLTPIRIYGVYIDGMVNRDIIENFFLSRIIDYKNLNEERIAVDKSKTKLIMDHFSATFDIKEVEKMDDMVNAVLSGDTAFLLMVSLRAWSLPQEDGQQEE